MSMVMPCMLLKICTKFCRMLAALKISAPAITRQGDHAPKYTSATAIKPAPAVMFSWNTLVMAMESDAPASPAITPPSVTVMYRTRVTLTPTESAASGFCPTARTSRPKFVRFSTHTEIGIRAKAIYTRMLCWNRALPKNGISLRPGIWIRWNPCTVITPPAITLNSRLDIPCPNSVKPMPLMPCSAFSVTLTKAIASPSRPPTIIATSRPIQGERPRPLSATV